MRFDTKAFFIVLATLFRFETHANDFSRGAASGACSPDEFANITGTALPPGEGRFCNQVAVVGMPSSHTSWVARLLKEVTSDGHAQYGILPPTVTLMPIHGRAFDEGILKIEHGPCTVVVVRDFREVVCSAARRHGDCEGCSAFAMEAKLKSWQHRIFHDPLHGHWAALLPRLESSGARFLRYECFSGCPEGLLANTFRRWLGHTNHPPGFDDLGSDGRFHKLPTATSLSSLSLSEGHSVDWQTCFTSATLANFQADLSEMAERYNYPITSEVKATCTGQRAERVSASFIAPAQHHRPKGSPAERLLRFEQRVNGLKVTGVDSRFRKRILQGNSGVAQARCNKQGCLPDFITIGAQKGGTTSLYHYLLQYSRGIETSRREELNFFTER
jgi:hypothetical protein